MKNKNNAVKILAFILIFSLFCSCSVYKTEEFNEEENISNVSSSVSSTLLEFEDNTEIEAYNEDDTFSVNSIKNIYIVESSNNDKIRTTAELIVNLFNSSGISEKSLKANLGKFSKRASGDIVFLEDGNLSNEGYRFVITEKNIYIYYNPNGNCNGMLYGAQDILKICLNSNDGFIECGEKAFSPDTKERTLMLDCARKCWSVKWIKNLIAEMSWLGFNTLELHLTEDQGIRANIWQDKNGKIIPDCNGNDFSFICGGTVVSWNEDYHEDINATYSRDDIVEIIECADKYHIDIIPSVDFPGHSKNLIIRSENKSANGFVFQYNGKTYSFNSNDKISADGSYSNTLDISCEFTRNLSYAVMQAYASFFKEYGCDRFDIASDEVSVNDSEWADFAMENGGSTMFDGYIIYVNKLCDILKNMGYTVRANNDFLFSERTNVQIDKNLQICYWKPTDREYGSANYLISDGRTVFNCVESYCYYVLRQSKSGYDARSSQCGWWDFHHSTAKRVFCGCGGTCGYSSCNESGGWNPSKLWGFSSGNKTVVLNDNLGGAYLYIWGDWAKWDTEENIFYRQDELGLVRRMWASSAKMLDWNVDKTVSWTEFEEYMDKTEYSPLIIR